MVTKNIKTDYGALGDGQIDTRTITIANGSKNLSATVNTWASEDVGKYIAFTNALNVGFRSTIATFTDAQHVVMADNFTGTSLSGVSKSVEWGTADDVAFANFNAAFVGQSGVILQVPAGRYPCLGIAPGVGSFLGPGFGIPDFTMVSIDGNGSGVLTDFQGTGSFWLGGTRLAQAQNNTGSARVVTVMPGATSLTLVSAADNTKFSNNTWALMTGVDLQAFGGPSNQYYWEPVFITNISGATITIQSPLMYTYKTAWPLWAPGDASNLDEGGPATLYSLNTIPGYNCVQEYIDMGFEQQGQTNSLGKQITFTRGYEKGAGIYATLCPQWTATNHTFSTSTRIEWDKLNGDVVVTGGSLHGNAFQSPSGNYVYSGVDCGDFNGTPKNLVLLNCTVTDATFGPGSYGRSESIYAQNSTFTGLAVAGNIGGVTEGDVTGVGAYSMSNGVIRRVKSAGTGSPPQWANPGAYCFYGSRYTSEAIFRIIDIYEDGTSIYIQTDQAGGFPSLVPPATTLSISTHPCPNFTFVNCTGCETAIGWSGIPVKQPVGSGWKRTYSGNIGTTLPVIPMIGKVVSVKFTVGTAYAAGSFNLDAPFLIQMSDRTAVQWSPVIDLTVSGVRTVTRAGVAGGSGSDSGLALPGAADVWMVPNQITPKMSGASGGGDITLEITTFQFSTTAVAKNCFRFHS